MTICNKCKIDLSVDHFKIKRDGSYTKTCDVCRGYAATARKKYKCAHGREKCKCVECGGSQMCEHKKQKSFCKKCTDPIKVTATNMVSHSKESDIKYNRYDDSQFIDYAFCENLLKTITHCPYDDCQIRLQHKIYDSTLSSIERIDNSIGHIKTNCIICCLACNIQKKSNHQSPTLSVKDVSSAASSD